MSDPTQAQAEDRRAQIQARLDDYAFKATLLAEMARDEATRNALRKFGQAFRDAATELSRLSRVEQALRELALKWRVQSEPYLDGTGDEAEWAACRTRCADELYAALSASPEAQPEEGK